MELKKSINHSVLISNSFAINSLSFLFVAARRVKRSHLTHAEWTELEEKLIFLFRFFFPHFHFFMLVERWKIFRRRCAICKTKSFPRGSPFNSLSLPFQVWTLSRERKLEWIRDDSNSRLMFTKAKFNSHYKSASVLNFQTKKNLCCMQLRERRVFAS